MEKIKVMVLDMNHEYYMKIKKDVEQDTDIKVIGYNNDGKDALEEITLKKPDIIITDDLLNTWDGMLLLERLKNIKELKDIITIFLSSIYSSKIKSMLIHKGANYVSNKRYKKRELIRLMKELYDEKKDKTIGITKKDIEIETYIRGLLRSIGIKTCNNGYKYLKEILIIKLKYRNYEFKDLTRVVGRRFQVKVANVSNAIRNIIISSFDKNKDLYFYNLSYNKNTSPKNEEFVDILFLEILMYCDV